MTSRAKNLSSKIRELRQDNDEIERLTNALPGRIVRERDRERNDDDIYRRRHNSRLRSLCSKP